MQNNQSQAESLVRTLGHVGGSVGEMAKVASVCFIEDDRARLRDGSNGVLEILIPSAWAVDLAAGPQGKVGQHVAGLMAVSDISRRVAALKKEDLSWSEGEIVRGLPGSELIKLAKKTHDTTSPLTHALGEGLKMAQTAWINLQTLQILGQKMAARREALETAAFTVSSAPAMSDAARAFELWDEKASQQTTVSSENLAVGRSLALLACGVEDEGVASFEGVSGARWEKARALLAGAKTLFAQPPQQLAPLSARIGPLPQLQPAKNPTGRYVWNNSSFLPKPEAFDHPLIAARWIVAHCPEQKFGQSHPGFLSTPESGKILDIQGAPQAWAQAVISGVEKALLHGAAKPAESQPRSGL